MTWLPLTSGEKKRASGMRSGRSSTGVKSMFRLMSEVKQWEKKPRRGGFRWWVRKLRRKPGSETRRRHRLQTSDARRRVDGPGGRRMRIWPRRLSSSSTAAADGEEARRRREISTFSVMGAAEGLGILEHGWMLKWDRVLSSCPVTGGGNNLNRWVEIYPNKRYRITFLKKILFMIL
jgi:hypothetical protein